MACMTVYDRHSEEEVGKVANASCLSCVGSSTGHVTCRTWEHSKDTQEVGALCRCILWETVGSLCKTVACLN